jgi:hypothetical protein
VSRPGGTYWQPIDGSFRDPSGFVFTRDGTLYRQVNNGFRPTFEAFLSSGLYDELARDGLLVPHVDAGLEHAATADAFAVLRPERIPFISYPYEWSFGELRDAALLTLELQQRALAKDFVLRDASAYNVQFRDGRPVFIDTLSFEPRVEGTPWIAYGLYFEHFLVPLALMSLSDVRCSTLLRSHLDGVPLDLGSRLLPRASWARLGMLLHVHLHAKAQSRYAGASVSAKGRGRTMSRNAVSGLVASLRSAVEGLSWNPAGTVWAEYATDNSYSSSAARSKRDILTEYLRPLGASTAWDLGANTGDYTRAAREVVPQVVSFDLDPAAVERNYRRVREQSETGILPLVLDLANPSPAQGWAHRERLSLEQRGPADVVLALALVHHLAIGRNLPLPRIADFLARLCRTLVIEFVPKEDSQVQRLLQNRPDIFPDYTGEGFERAFGARMRIDSVRPVEDSGRQLYLRTACAPDRAAA